MNGRVSIVCGSFFALACLLVGPLQAEVGEFHIPSVLPLEPAQCRELRRVVREDEEAAALAAGVRKQARPLLNAEPRPLEVIHYEGLVNTNPKRIASVENLRDMTKAAWLLRYWQAFGDEDAAATLRRFIDAWFGTYKLTGNDVNENKLFPLLVAYDALRESFPSDRREEIDAFCSRLGTLHLRRVTRARRFTNRFGKSLRLLAMTGMILEKPEWVKRARDGVKRFVEESLYADGTSHDLKRRDTLTYHGSALKKPIDLAIMLGKDGWDLYSWESPKGGSLKKSSEYVVPYALGDKTHREWVNSKSDLDRRRADAGLEKYRRGRLYEPENAQELMGKAAYFDPDLMRVVRHLHPGEAERFPTWQTLMNSIKRPDKPPDAE